MIVYVASFAMILLAGYFYKQKIVFRKKGFLIFVFVILGTVAAFRDRSVGVDTSTYLKMYYTMKLNISSRIEPGFRLLCQILKEISSNERLLLWITGYFCAAGFCIFIYRYSKNPLFSICLLLFYNYYFSMMNVMRQYIALSICLLALPLCKKNKGYYCFFVLVACSFHYTAIVMLIWIFFINNKSTAKKIIVKLLIAGVAGYYLLPVILNTAMRIFPQYRFYYNTSYMDSNNFGAFIEAMRIGCILMITILAEKDKEDIDISMIMLCIAFILQMFGTRVNILARIVQYFSIFEIIALPNILHDMKSNNIKMVMTLCVILVSLGYFIIVAIFRPGWHGAIPYVFWQE